MIVNDHDGKRQIRRSGWSDRFLIGAGQSMQSPGKIFGNDLNWVQRTTLIVPVYELRDGQEIVATLTFRSAFGSLATAECADGCWTFKRVGFFQTRVSIRECGIESDFAVFKNNTWTNGGTFQLADGRTYQASTNFWGSKFDIINAAGESLVHYATRFVSGKRVIVVQPAAVGLDVLPLLALCGWYLLVMSQSEEGAAAAAACAAGA